MLMNPLPHINKTFSLLIQQERQTFIPSTDDNPIMANFSKPIYRTHLNDFNNKSFTPGRGRGMKVCRYCNKIGYTIEVCFKKHGFPPYLKIPTTSQANMVVDCSNSDQFEDNEGQPSTASIIPFTEEQHKVILALIQQTSNDVLQIQQFQNSLINSSDILPTPSFLDSN